MAGGAVVARMRGAAMTHVRREGSVRRALLLLLLLLLLRAPRGPLHGLRRLRAGARGEVPGRSTVWRAHVHACTVQAVLSTHN